MEILDLTLISVLWDTWGKNPPKVPPDGNRLFSRHVDSNIEQPGWDDWRLIGLLKPDGSIDWVGSEPDAAFSKPIQEQIASKVRFSRLLCNGYGIEWGLFHGDGPLELRVSDWAQVHESK